VFCNAGYHKNQNSFTVEKQQQCLPTIFCILPSKSFLWARKIVYFVSVSLVVGQFEVILLFFQKMEKLESWNVFDTSFSKSATLNENPV